MYVSNREQAVQKRIFCELKLAEKNCVCSLRSGEQSKKTYIHCIHKEQKLTFCVYISVKNVIFF